MLGFHKDLEIMLCWVRRSGFFVILEYELFYMRNNRMKTQETETMQGYTLNSQCVWICKKRCILSTQKKCILERKKMKIRGKNLH